MAFDERSGNFSLVFTPAPDPSEDGANACANGAAFVTEVTKRKVIFCRNYIVAAEFRSYASVFRIFGARCSISMMFSPELVHISFLFCNAYMPAKSLILLFFVASLFSFA